MQIFLKIIYLIFYYYCRWFALNCKAWLTVAVEVAEDGIGTDMVAAVEEVALSRGDQTLAGVMDRVAAVIEDLMNIE